MSSTPIQYSSVTFNTILNDINADPILRAQPLWWKNYLAGVGDVLSMIRNAQANQTYLETAFTEDAVDRLTALIDYQRTPQLTASGVVLFYISRSAIFPVSIPTSDLVAFSIGGASVTAKRFEGRAPVTVSAFSEAFTAAITGILTVARIYTTGELVQVSSTGTLPGGLSAATDYYVIYVSATQIKLASSLTDAYNGVALPITDTGTGTHTIRLFTAKVVLYQQTTSQAVTLGNSDGITAWQEYDLPDAYALRDTLVITINGVDWTAVDTFVYSVSTDKVYKVKWLSEGKARIQFGNGVYGEIPAAFPVQASYAYGGGAESNVPTIGNIDSYAGASPSVTGVSNPAAISGGADRQSMDDAKNLAPMLLKTRDRDITTSDGRFLVESYGGASRIKVNKLVYGPLSQQIVLVPTGGGTASPSYLSALSAYLTDRSILESIDTRSQTATYVTTAFTSALKILPGYDWTTTKAYYEIALTLMLSEVGYEIYTDYLQNGIASAVGYINSKYSTTFSMGDYGVIAAILNNMNTYGMIADIGLQIDETPLVAVLQSVPGVDYFTISVPAFPITPTNEEIVTPGTITTSAL